MTENQIKYQEAKAYLESTDYVVIKISEGVATKTEYKDVLTKRAEARKTINDLETIVKQEQLEEFNKANTELKTYGENMAKAIAERKALEEELLEKEIAERNKVE